MTHTAHLSVDARLALDLCAQDWIDRPFALLATYVLQQIGSGQLAAPAQGIGRELFDLDTTCAKLNRTGEQQTANIMFT
jgi:hypothetical protein